MANLNKSKFYSVRAATPGYIEHIYVDQDGRQLLVATVYETLDKRYKFSCKWKLFSESYNTVADAKHDLFQVIEYNTGSRIDLPA